MPSQAADRPVCCCQRGCCDVCQGRQRHHSMGVYAPRERGAGGGVQAPWESPESGPVNPGTSATVSREGRPVLIASGRAGRSGRPRTSTEEDKRRAARDRQRRLAQRRRAFGNA